MASNSASVVQGVPGGRCLVRSFSCRLHTSSDTSTKCNSCSTSAHSTISRNQARCDLVLPGKSRTIEMPFDNMAQICGARAFLNREERSKNSATLVISPGKRPSRSSSCTRRTALPRSARSLASVDFPAAILPHKNISFAGWFIPRASASPTLRPIRANRRLVNWPVAIRASGSRSQIRGYQWHPRPVN